LSTSGQGQQQAVNLSKVTLPTSGQGQQEAVNLSKVTLPTSGLGQQKEEVPGLIRPILSMKWDTLINSQHLKNAKYIQNKLY